MNEENEFNNLLTNFYINLGEEKYIDCYNVYMKMKQYLANIQKNNKYSIECEFCHMIFSKLGLKYHIEICPERKGRKITMNLEDKEDIEYKNQNDVFNFCTEKLNDIVKENLLCYLSNKDEEIDIKLEELWSIL